jgi:hypothetical protein
LGCAIEIWIVAAQQNATLISIDESVVPAGRLCGTSPAKVLGEEGGAVAKSLDVIASMSGKDLCFDESLTQPRSLCGVTRLVNLVLVHSALRPVIGSGRLRRRAAVVFKGVVRAV